MYQSVLEKSALFSGVPADELKKVLEETPHHVQRYDKGEIIFRLMEPAENVGIILEGRVEAQKSFSNGSQVNVSVREAGEVIGPAAVLSKSRKYPCVIVSLEPVSIMMFRREDLLGLMQKDVRILENLTTEIASATYMLQQRLELFSYSGIAQKAAFWLLMQARQTGSGKVRIPGSVSKWALQMNVSRPSLHRELKRLEEQSVISYAPPFIIILDPDALQDVLG
ncbi:MAG: Crp/Fnr family transcriptional regulator [Firmicutes bacterium]|nr:Crp/Fnr family transcriptional regulator [Bacillota bacterium]